MSRPGNRSTAQDRSRRRVAIVAIIIGVVIVVGWIAAISALAGGSKGSQQGGAEGAASDSSVQEQASADAPANAPSETTADQGEAPEGGETDPQQAVAGEAKTGDVFDPLEEENQDSSGQPDGSTDSEQAGPGGLSEIDKTRARAASEHYIVAAYGYSGGSEDAYLEGIERAASEQIYGSPGGAMLEGYSKAAPECGMRSTAILEEFEVVGQSPDGLDVAVTFSDEDADGETHTFRQDQRLTSTEGGYEVSGVSMEELISNTTPTQSCPGAQSKADDNSKEGESGGEGESEVKPDETGVADEDRAKAAADLYITSAYGYTGESGKEYHDRIARTVNEEKFYSSTGGQRVQEYAKAAENEGMKSAAVMERFEISSTEGSSIEGTAYSRVAESYDRYGGIKGQSTPFAIDLKLSPSRSTYEVSSASAERQVSERQITEGHAKKTS